LFVARGELAAQALARARALGVPRRDVAELPRVWYSAAPNSEIERTHYAMVAERIRSVVEAKELPQPELTRPELTRP